MATSDSVAPLVGASNSSVAPFPNTAENSPTVLEDYLTKQGSRSKNFWHDRYFILTADGTLRYFKKKGDELKPKASLVLNRLPDCEVSELYVAKQKNQLLYCVKITWSASGALDPATVNFVDDGESVFSGGGGTVLLNQQGDEAEMDVLVPAGSDGAEEKEVMSSKKKRNIFRKKKKSSNVSSTSIDKNSSNRDANSRDSFHEPQREAMEPSLQQQQARSPAVFRTPPRRTGSKVNKNSSNNNNNNNNNNNQPTTPRSVDAESLTMGTRAHQSSTTPVSNIISSRDLDGVPAIPEMVEVEPICQGDDNGDGGSTLTVRVNNSTANQNALSGYQRLQSARSYDNEDNEMEYLRAQFLATEKEKKRITKRKVADGAKFAAAAGAAVGVAVVTVGIGLVAGLVALGVGAAAGASGTATGLAWKKKRQGVVVIGTADYEKMRRWKACLDASLNSGILQKSKWGQAFAGNEGKRRMLIFPKAGDYGHHKTFSNCGVGDVPFPSPDSNSMQREVGAMFFESTVQAKWKPLEGGWTSFLGTGPQGLRIFREEPPDPSLSNRRKALFRNYLSVDGRPCPPMKAHLVLNATPLDAFLCLMSQGQLVDTTGPLSPNSGQRSSFRLIESIDDNTDVIHLVCNPLYLFPSWTSPRDYVLYRYWRLEEDGSFIVCFESVQHKDCPSYPGYCRGEMHQVFTVAPHKKTQRRKGGSTKDQLHECLMTAVVQVDPKGWVPIAPVNLLSNQGYGDAFAVAALVQLLDIRDAIDQDRFIPVALDDSLQHVNTSMAATQPFMDQKLMASSINNIPRIDSMGSDPYQEDLVNYDFSFANRETEPPADSPTGLSLAPPPLLHERWAEPDSNSFRVRGPMYKVDHKKFNAGDSIGRLVAVDVVRVDAPIYSGLTAHPTERVQLALKKEKSLKEKGLESDMPPYLFVVNIVLPGPPFYHGVFYYAIDDMSTIDGSDGSPSSRLCKEFLFGDSDAFRDRTFKLIPQIVEGNFIVRKAVGSTPAIMGKKLKQNYVRTERSLEVVLDCGSSSVATGVIRLSLGYAKTLVVDMGFLFEGDSDEFLPERIFGSARIRHLEFGPQLRKVEQPPPENVVASASS